MLRIKNTRTQYGLIAVLLHWSMAALIVLLLTIGLYMITLPNAPLSAERIRLVLWHKELGIWALIIVLFRLTWRLLNQSVQLPEGMPWWQKQAAHASHWMLYACMLLMPMTGWLMSSSGGYPVFFMGQTLPDLTGVNFDHYMTYRSVHKWIAYTLILLISVHAAAALHHHFIMKDNVLRKMLFFWRKQT